VREASTLVQVWRGDIERDALCWLLMNALQQYAAARPKLGAAFFSGNCVPYTVFQWDNLAHCPLFAPAAAPGGWGSREALQRRMFSNGF